MGTTTSITLVTTDSVAAVPQASAAQAVFARVDSLMTNSTTTSEVARLNREAAAGTTSVHPEVALVIDAALRVWRESGHAFDITVEPLTRAWGFAGGPHRVPPQPELDAALASVGAQQLTFDSASRTLHFKLDGVKIDLGGIARGYAVDAAADTLRALGVRNALVEISGTLVALGSPAHADDWRVDLRDPRDRVPVFAHVRLAPGRAISTSGRDEPSTPADGSTHGHILDPRSGRPPEGLISVTVLAPDAMTADAWSTALFVLGPADAKRIARERADISALLVEPGADGIDTLWVESDLRERFTLEIQGTAPFRVEYY
jgi:thiamine biosynthesis lipoprotein